MSKHQVERDCTRKCQSQKHGHELTSAITKRSIKDEALASYIKAKCFNFNKAFDYEGRTALHMAASQNRVRVMEWLVRHSSGTFINARDRESGYTPLHRSIFYGQINAAVNLMKLGADTEILDSDDYRALEHATLDHHYMYNHIGDGPCDVYVWGSNANYTLGTGSQQARNVPELLACFSRGNEAVKQVILGKFHSVWLTESGVWVGGQAGRAGGGPATLLRPARLRTHEPVVAATLTLTDTVLLMASGNVLQYGINSTNHSNHSSKSAVISPPSTKPIFKLDAPLGLCSSRNHVVVWNATKLYSWGINWGQLGHSPDEKIVALPRKIGITVTSKEDVVMKHVSAANAATAIATSRGDVYLLHKHACKKIAMKQINLRQLCAEANVNEQGVYSRVTVLLLNNVGQLMIWQDTTNTLTRCVFGLNHQTIITHIALTHDALYFTTKRGEAFIGHISRKAPPTRPQQPIRKEREKDGRSSLVKFLEKDDCTSVRITRIPNVHRATAIAVDSEGINFACLQIKPTCGLTSLPEVSPPSLAKHMETFLNSTSEDDILHDVVFKVGTKSYPAHIYMVANHSEYLYKLYQEAIAVTDQKPTIVLENINPEIFERILKYMYTGSCDVTEPGPCELKLKREDLVGYKKDKDEYTTELIENPAEISAFEVYKQDKGRPRRRSGAPGAPGFAPREHCDPVKLVQAAAKRLGVMGLHKLLERFYYHKDLIHCRGSPPPPLALPRAGPRADVRLRGAGPPAPAHRCVLAARLQYFEAMFLTSWTESSQLSEVTLSINGNLLQPVLDFLYTDTCPEVEASESIDFLYNMLIVADQLFITRLREMCEVALANMITLRNCTEICQFAHTYNAIQLKRCCMEFICLNIAPILEGRSLEAVEDSLLDDITQYYCKFNPIMASRVITPFYNAPSDEVIEEIAKNFPVDLELTEEDVKKDDSVIEVAKSKNRKIKYTESEKARMRYESVSSVNSLDLSHNSSGDITLSLSKITKEAEKSSKEKHGKWIEVTSTQQKQSVIQARLKAISSAKDILNEPPVEAFTTLRKNSSWGVLKANTDDSSSSRLSMSPKESPVSESPRTLQGNIVINHVGPKLSQKQRKKLGNSTAPQNLNNYFDKLTVESPPEKPKNPWKICEAPIASSSPLKSKAIEFNKILADQKKQKDDSSRIMTKSLILTQLEDKAIEELEKFYNIHNIDDEMITVRRIELQVLSPQWVHTCPK